MKETVCILSLPAESRGLGGNPMTRKIQKITPEWQSEPFFCSVGSAVARVKGKHHDGDAAKLGWHFVPSIQVVPRTLSSCRDERVFLY